MAGLRGKTSLAVFGLGLGLLVPLLVPRLAWAERSLEEHRYFRALAIDLLGRVPSRAEVSGFEAPDFDLEVWLDQHLVGPAYSARLQRVYMDALRLEVGDNFVFRPNATVLRRYPIKVQEPDGSAKKVWVYHRFSQRRALSATDRGFCFTEADTGQTFVRGQAPNPVEPTMAVPRAAFETRVAKVRPWWLYRDFRSKTPANHYASWQPATEPRFLLGLPGDRVGPAASYNDPRLLVDADGSPTTDVYVCKEEASVTEAVSVTLRGQSVTLPCTTDLGMSSSSSCGCGPGLEWCMPAAGPLLDPPAVVLPSIAPLGLTEPFEVDRQRQSDWWRLAWGEEARRFLDDLFTEDRDFREVLTSRRGIVNGPLAQFYRAPASSDCCADQLALGAGVEYAVPESLFEPARVPSDLLPHEMDRWVKVPDRGPRAAGILTLPAFLAKFASRRGRANAVYNAFLCREFVAENVKLEPSTEPNLMVRSGCATCHAKLEPLAAYFARTKESSFSFIAAPVDNPLCKVTGGVMPNASCTKFYDPAFSSATTAQLRGAYGSPANVEAGPAGLAREVVLSPEFSSCVARTVTEAMLGRRTTTPTDDGMLRELETVLVESGFRLRPLMRAVLKSNAYRNANSLASGGR